MEKWYVIDEVTGEEFGPFEDFDSAHDFAPSQVPDEHTFRVEERS